MPIQPRRDDLAVPFVDRSVDRSVEHQRIDAEEEHKDELRTIAVARVKPRGFRPRTEERR